MISKIKKYALYIIGGFIILSLFAFGFSGDSTASIMATFEKEFNEQINDYGRTTTFSAGSLFEKSKKIAEHLGTHKDGSSSFENELGAISIVLQCNINTDDYFFLESAYKHYQTNERNLTTDLFSYLSGSQYNDISHIVSRQSLKNRARLLST